MSARKKIIISGVNLIEGGPLTVLRDCVDAAVQHLSGEWEIIVLVHDKALIRTMGVTVLEFPLSKRSWLRRLYYEWWFFRRLSKKLNPDFWLSLHDITPFVGSCPQAVYCHNATPFYRIISAREIWLDPKLLMFSLFYRYLYGIGIHRNKFVIVQQEWLRREFKQLFKVPNIVVAYPVSHVEQVKVPLQSTPRDKYIFIYPSLPRVFKNIELLCDAVKILNLQGISGFEVRLTVDGSENRYATYLLKKYASTPGLQFIGRQTRQEMVAQYVSCDCVLFPSRLETWGLPISEAKAWGKPLLVSELPYAHEAVGDYDRVGFVDPRNPEEWAYKMKLALTGEAVFHEARIMRPELPFAQDWHELIKLLTNDQPPSV